MAIPMKQLSMKSRAELERRRVAREFAFKKWGARELALFNRKSALAILNQPRCDFKLTALRF